MEAEENSFGRWLRNQRRNLDLSRQALADQVGCAEITLRRIESGSLKPSKELAGILLAKLGIPESAQAQWLLFARGLSGLPAGTDETPSTRPQSNLPVFLTEFIGRKKEQAALLQLIGAHRLVTLTGPGGVGKTRLAAMVAEQVSQQYPDGLQMVELASLTDPELVPQVVAAAFKVVSRSSIPYAEFLLNFLRPKSALIILDNCEHLLSACAQLADALLKNCPGVKIMATAREPLLVAGEAVYQVPSLGIPQADESLKHSRQSESIRLFEERAQLARPDFVLDQQNVFSVAHICRRLDGIPLAIELAAARVGIFSVEQIAARLDQSFDLLTGGSRTGLPRQQTLRGSMDWSWDLLSEAERLLLCRLSVFSGGWTLEAAEFVCSGDGIESRQVVELIAQLAAKSLVVVSQGPGPDQRYGLHEIIRQYAHEKLGGQEKILTRTRHLRYYLKFSEQAEPAFYGPQQMDWVARVNVELGNIRSALDWASGHDVRSGLWIIGQLGGNMDFREGLHWTSELLDKPESHRYPGPRARALLAHAYYLWYVQQFEASRSACQECLDLSRDCGDRLGEFDALMALGSAYQFLEGMQRKSEFQLEALALARSLGDRLREAHAMNVMGWDRRDPPRANHYWDEAITIYRDLGDWRNLAFLLGVYGDTLLAEGDLEAAEPFLREAEEFNQRLKDDRGMEFVLVARSRQALLARDFAQARACLEQWLSIVEGTGNRMGYLWGRARLGYVALLEGSLEEGSRHLREAAREFHRDHNKVGLAFTLEKMAYLFTLSGLSERALRLLGWADHTRAETGDIRPVLEQVDVDRDIAACRSRLGAEAAEAAMDEGRRMSFDEAFALPLQDH